MATPNLTAITVVTPGILASGQIASANTDTTVFTVAANKAAKLATMTVTNVGASNSTVSVSVVPVGGSVDGTHRVVSAATLLPGDSTVISEITDAWLGAGDFISINASSAATTDYLLTGLVFA